MTTIPSDVLAFLAELAQFSSALIEKYYSESEAEIEKDVMTANKAFKYFAPMSVEIHTPDGMLARFMEEGVEIYPDEE